MYVCMYVCMYESWRLRPLCDEFLLHHRYSDPHGSQRGALSTAGLQDEQHSILHCKLDVLNDHSQ
jgi:hypothetical protein